MIRGIFKGGELSGEGENTVYDADGKIIYIYMQKGMFERGELVIGEQKFYNRDGVTTQVRYYLDGNNSPKKFEEHIIKIKIENVSSISDFETNSKLIEKLSELINLSPKDEFGYSVATTTIEDIGIIAVGDLEDDDVALNSGAAYIFKTTDNKIYTLEGKIIPDSQATYEIEFGDEIGFGDERLGMNSRSGGYAVSMPIEWILDGTLKNKYVKNGEGERIHYVRGKINYKERGTFNGGELNGKGESIIYYDNGDVSGMEKGIFKRRYLIVGENKHYSINGVVTQVERGTFRKGIVIDGETKYYDRDSGNINQIERHISQGPKSIGESISYYRDIEDVHWKDIEYLMVF